MNLTDKYSGLPLWTWGVLGGGVIGATYLFVSRFRAAKKPAATTVAQPTDNGPLIIPLAGPPGQSIQGEKGDKGETGAQGAAGVPIVQTVAPSAPKVQPTPTVWTPVASAAPTPVPATTQRSYTIVPGDTLTGIARRFGISNYMTIYNANRDRIEAAAHAHGKSSSGGPEPGHWIWPGTMLSIPG